MIEIQIEIYDTLDEIQEYYLKGILQNLIYNEMFMCEGKARYREVSVDIDRVSEWRYIR